MKVLSIRKWMIVPVMGLVWLLALLYGSGIGTVYDVYGKAKLLVLALTVYHLVYRGTFQRIPRRLFYVIFYLLCCSTVTYLLYGKTMLDYLWLYLMTLLIAMLPVEEVPMRLVSIMYGGLGMAVLFIYNYGSAFSGWNTNSLAMIAFFSFAVMIASFQKWRNAWVFLVLLIYLAVYYWWSEPLNSRGSLLFTALMIVIMLDVLPFREWFRKRGALTVLLLLPFLIAVAIVLIRNTGLAQQLDTWSYTTFQKPIFNGRDTLWYRGFQMWGEHFLIGNGNLSASNWHNSAVTVLVGGGAVGFAIWVLGTRGILEHGTQQLDDQVVFGLMTGFFAIWLQQSVELGLVAAQANAIPYAMLGLLVGRVRTLRARKEEEQSGTKKR